MRVINALTITQDYTSDVCNANVTESISRLTEKIVSIFLFISRVVTASSDNNSQRLANQGSVSEALTRANIVPIWGGGGWMHRVASIKSYFLMLRVRNTDTQSVL